MGQYEIGGSGYNKAAAYVDSRNYPTIFLPMGPTLATERLWGILCSRPTVIYSDVAVEILFFLHINEWLFRYRAYRAYFFLCWN